MKQKSHLNQDALQPIELMRAFENFNMLSRRLERRYRRLQVETESLREQLRVKDLEVKRSERLAVLGETAAGIAHEVRNPLGSIKLFVSLLKKDLVEQPAALRLACEIERSVNKLENVVSNILQFSKEDVPCASPVNVHAILREQVNQFSRTEKGLSFEVKLQGNAFVQGDEHSLEQVFYNLILNAVQALKGSGTIFVSAEDRDGCLEVCVADNGPGIATDMGERIFDPFVTDKGNGTGLGLTIVKKIVSRHGGHISFVNLNGASFTVLLPRKTGGAG
ncbi:MAG: hypothetical protein GX589_06625 [Deltaproteobacteria bacterium]|nr:hypothetical protein [Deltaproteobacteria bacterium]